MQCMNYISLSSQAYPFHFHQPSLLILFLILPASYYHITSSSQSFQSPTITSPVSLSMRPA